MITIRGIPIAAINNGQRLFISQSGRTAMEIIRAIGKAIEAAIEASEIYRHSKTATTHIKKAAAAQIV